VLQLCSYIQVKGGSKGWSQQQQQLLDDDGQKGRLIDAPPMKNREGVLTPSQFLL
jgi:hypothetical protein